MQVTLVDYLKIKFKALENTIKEILYNKADIDYVDERFMTTLSFNEIGELVVTINGVSKIFVPKA